MRKRHGGSRRGVATRFGMYAAMVLVLALAAGCAESPGEPGGNHPPETGLVFIGDVDTTLYIQEIRWWGSDRDGDVAGFYYRWVPATPDSTFDTTWVFTTAGRDTFTLPTASGSAAYTFFVRSVDDRGALDPTPASQAYPFRNAAPTCSLTTVDAPDFPDTLFPSFTLRWVAHDPDGDETIARFLIWHDGNEANPIVIEDGAARSGPLGPSDFAAYGDRTIYFQAIDTGQRGCEPDSFRANILPVAAPVLLVDDMTTTDPAGGTSPDPNFPRFADFFYATNLDTFFGPGNYATLDLERFPIESTGQARALLSSFQTVIWYDQISDSASSPSLAAARDAMPDWIADGGKILVVSTYVLGTNVISFNPSENRGDTIPEVFFADRDPRFRRLTVGVDRILSNGRQITQVYDLVGDPSAGLGNLRHNGFANISFDVFTPTDEAISLYTIPAGTVIAEGLDTLKEEGTVGILRPSGSGRMILMGFPFSRMRFYQNHNCELRAVLCLLEGMNPCPCPPP